MAAELTPLDATFLELEEIDESAHMHIGGVMIFEAAPGRRGAPPIDEIRGRLAARLEDLPRFRHRLSEQRTGGLHWPRWIPDEYFDIERHIWQETLPEPRGEDELRAWAGSYFSERLTRSRPLWEIVSLELAGGGWALVSKTHHCMVDGVGSIDIAQTILDAEREHPVETGTPRRSSAGGGPQPIPRYRRESAPLPARLVSEGAGLAIDAARAGVGLARTTVATLLHPRDFGVVARRAEAVTELLIKSELVAAPATTLNEPIGPARGLGVVDASLADLKEISRALGGTVNDVVLAVAGTAMRRLLIERGELLPDRGLRAMVPVNIRDAAKRLELGNEITSLFVELPVAIPDPIRRYTAQVEQAETLKSGSQATGSRALIDLSGHAPPILHTFLARALYSTRLFNVTITNVPGPQIPLYAFGSRMRAIWPIVPLAAEHALGLAVFSYDGRLFFCYNGDPESVAELDWLAETTGAAIDELLAAARQKDGGEKRID
jgi:WS/DGAT/MGAT family acyltransferase